MSFIFLLKKNMKKLISFVLVIALLVSCSGNKEERIIGYWQLQKVRTNQKIEHQQQYAKAMREMIRTTSIEFRSDGSFGASLWSDTSFGYWQIKGDSLFINDKSNRNRFGVKIAKLKRNELILLEKHDSIIEMLTFSR